jgi:hypothetical protein
MAVAEQRFRGDPTMKRLTQLALACMLVLSVVPLVAAQQVPQPVVRLGDWVEVAPEVFMNWIVTTDIRYQTVENYDFENRIQDRPGSRDPHSTVPHGGDADILWEESRIGVDVRYLKNLKMQVLFEQQATMDGNTIDQTVTPSPGPAVQTYSNGGDLLAAPSERNTVNLERFWIDYSSRCRWSGCACGWGRTCGTRIRPGCWGTTTRALRCLPPLGPSRSGSSRQRR